MASGGAGHQKALGAEGWTAQPGSLTWEAGGVLQTQLQCQEAVASGWGTLCCGAGRAPQIRGDGPPLLA